MSETISRPFTFVKDGVFNFSRCMPKELKGHCLPTILRALPNW